ncbi:PLP-dependent transferase [Shinella curvata]|uniref:PLP-dependent transferase n=1 Tax=Shinella curvata TaxID=1817964 RepID=A0ABT8XB63_9HYPH|nr:PLP-dependent transferase [Shinella curvata]MCJ8054633.1 PLP-dependent transferase [Shinella curvata]MDO6120972.1 PLP-dependent transferase [Shinella curvata]
MKDDKLDHCVASDENDFGFATRAIFDGGAAQPRSRRNAAIPLCGRAAHGTANGTDSQFLAPADALAKKLAGLEGANDGLLFNSAAAAFTTLVLATSSPGDRVIMHRSACTATTALMQNITSRIGVEMIAVDLTDLENLRQAATGRSHLVFFETPSNPLNEVLDIREVSRAAHQLDLKVAVDATFASPALQRPLEHGADVVLHSLTRYVNGHGDTMGGGLFSTEEFINGARRTALTLRDDTTLSTDAAYMVSRGLSTLALRMARHSASAHAVALSLESHPAVKWVRYPFLNSHPDYSVALRQMAAGSGMLAFGLRADERAIGKAIGKLRLFSPALNAGEVGSLFCTCGDISQAQHVALVDADLCDHLGTDVVRLSIGLEDAEDLIEDLWQALDGL